ncbi:MAG TPA: HAMP domain-containing sensor histidine kinase [Gemmatimonadaceae bacterium]|nr:HAMP domain-containing sensor histidine kinase [Gemmatimonadaceae bacterium]
MAGERPNHVVSRLTVPLLIGLVAAVVGVSAVLAYEAYRARHSMRVTAERALAQYATMAGWELDAATRARLARALDELFAPVSGVAQSPYDRSPDPGVLLPRSATLGLSCGSGPAVLRVDLAGDGLTRAGSALADTLIRTIVGGIQQRLRSASAADTRFMVPFAYAGGLRLAAVGVRTARFGVPVAAYAVPDCDSRLLMASVNEALRHDALLPADVRGAMPNDSLVSVQIRDTAGPFVRTSDVAGREELILPLRAFPGFTAHVALRPAARAALLVSPPERSRLPLLVGLLLLCVVLALVALIQLRREHELARLRADFTSSVSHELRTPLAQIMLFGETLSLQRARSDDERALAATSIVREARRLVHMVDNILHFSHRKNAAEAAPEQLELEAYLNEIVSSFTPLAAAASMRIENRVRDAVVEADPAMLRQVVLNLLDNAVKYGPSGQTIVVDAVAAEDGSHNGSSPRVVRLTVTDDGAGIAPSDRERVWSPYVRLRHNGTARRAGSGIGLAVVRELVQAMHGRTWVESPPNGRGARFVVELPSPRTSPLAPRTSSP